MGSGERSQLNRETLAGAASLGENSRDEDGATALYFAVSHKNIEALERLKCVELLTILETLL